MTKEKDGQPKESWKENIGMIIGIGLTIGVLGFGVYICTQINSSRDDMFTSDNATSVCNLSAEVLSTKNTVLQTQAEFSGFLPDAEKAWSKSSCDTVLLTDNFGNTCLGSTGFKYNGLDKNGMGIFSCSNISQSIIDQKIKSEAINK